MKRILFLACIMQCFFLTSCKQETKVEKFVREAKELTKQCPIAIDSCTNLDSLIYDKDLNQYQYYYSLYGANEVQFKEEIVSPAFIKKIKDSIINSVDMKPYKDANLNFVYFYYAKESNTFLGKIEVTPSDYK